VVQKIGYLGVLWERKTVINVPHSVREGCLWILESHIYACGRIYLKNEAAFGFDQDQDLVLLRRDCRIGNVGGGELLNF
jgi:hypothetical protein